MKYTRPLSLVSLAASLLLAACSQILTPQASELVPQFGSADRDIGVSVLIMPDGGATSLSY